MKKLSNFILIIHAPMIRDLSPLRLCPSQTEGTGREFHSRYLMSYSLCVTNLNAAQIFLRPKWPQILVIASSNCSESELNFCMPSVDCETLQCQYPKLISILIAETFLLIYFMFSSCFFQTKLGPFMTRTHFNQLQLSPTPRADRNRPFLRLDSHHIRK